MNSIDRCKEYIQDSIINRLERMMGNEEVEEVNLWEKYKKRLPRKTALIRTFYSAV